MQRTYKTLKSVTFCNFMAGFILKYNLNSYIILNTFAKFQAKH